MESDDDNYVEEEESELSCYDLFTQNLPIQIAGSEKYGGKGVIVRNNVEAGEELYEEEPIFSWMVGEDVVEHLRQHMGRKASKKFESDAKRRKKGHLQSPMFHPSAQDDSTSAIPTILFSLSGPRVKDLLPLPISPLASCFHCLRTLPPALHGNRATVECNCGYEYCNEECKEKSLMYAHYCLPATEEMYSAINDVEELAYQCTAFRSGQIPITALLYTYFHLGRKFQEYIDMEMDNETAGYLALSPLSRFVGCNDELAPILDYDSISKLLKCILQAVLPQGLWQIAPTLCEPNDLREKLGQLALNSHSIHTVNSATNQNIEGSSSSSSSGGKGNDAEVLKGAGLFMLLSCFNHSCDPNCEVAHTADRTVLIRTLRKVESGEELTISYIPEHLPVDERNALLYSSFLIPQCSCSKCKLERISAQ